MLPESVRGKVVWLWFHGNTEKEIAEKTPTSLGSVRNILDEFRAGRYSQYDSYREYFDDMRWLAKRLRKENRPLKETVAGLAAIDALGQLGINPSELPRMVELFRRLSGPGFPVERFAAAALRIADIEKTTKIDFDGLEEENKRRQDEITAKKEELKELTNSVESIKADKRKEETDLEQLRLSSRREFEQNRVTNTELENYVKVRDGLTSKGVSVEKLNSLTQVIVEFEKYDWQAEAIIKDIETNGSVKARLQIVREDLSKAQTGVDAGREELNKLNKQIVNAEARVEQLGSTEANANTRLSETKQELASNYLRVELVETFFGLLHNPGMVSDWRIAAMIDKLNQILKARQGTPGLQINYDRMREELVFFVQTVLGDVLVPRATFNGENGGLRNELTDLKMGRLGKLENDRKAFKKEQEEFLLTKHRFETASIETLLVVAVRIIKEGNIHLMICNQCRLVFACAESPTSRYGFRSGCPRCYGSSQQYSIARLERKLKEKLAVESC